MRIVYLDLYFLLNLLCDYLLCLSTARLCSLQLKRGQYWLSALLGSAAAVAGLFPSLAFLSGPGGVLCVWLLMGWIAFGTESAPLRCILALGLTAAAFGGLLYAAQFMGFGTGLLSLRRLLFSFCLCYGLVKLLAAARRPWDHAARAQIRLRQDGKEICFPAMIDSGNALREPSTGCRVMIVSLHALQPILGADTVLLQELDPVELVSVSRVRQVLGQSLRLISYKTLSGSGLMPVFRPQELWIDDQPDQETLIAISREAEGNGFKAIL